MNDPNPGFEFFAYLGEDDTPIVYVETPAEWDTDQGPRCRVYLNEGDPLWANPDYVGGGYVDENLESIRVQLLELGVEKSWIEIQQLAIAYLEANLSDALEAIGTFDEED